MTGWPVWEVVSATGHRPQHLTADEQSWIRDELARIVVKLSTEYGTTTGISGMALGVDTWWAESVLDVGLRLSAHVPFPQQADPWPATDRATWQQLCAEASEVVRYGDAYDVKLFHARNDGMLGASNAVVAVYKPSKASGGTAGAVRKARQRGLPIVHLNPGLRTVRLLRPSAEVPA